MQERTERRRIMRRAVPIVAAAAAGLFLFIGCREEAESPAGSDLVSSSVSAEFASVGDGIALTVEEIDASLDLTDDQAAALAPVLAAWSEAAAEREAERDGRRAEGERMRGRRGRRGGPGGHRNGPPEAPEGEPPILVLLEGSRETLTNEQYVGLIELLAGKQEALRAERESARGERPEGRLGRPPRGGFHEGMAEELNLTEEQRTALQAIHESERERVEALRASGDREANREAMRAIHEETRAAAAEILTEEQRAALEDLREERREEYRERAEERSAERIGRHAEWLVRALGLDDTQRTGVEAVLEQAHDSVRALLESAREEGDREGLRDEMVSIRNESVASIRALLTEEQAAAFDALADLLPERGGPGGHHGPLHE